MKQRILTMTTIGAMVATMALAGCDRREQAAAKNDTAVAMDRAGNAAENAGTKMSDKIDDAMITTSVKAELAKDANLSATRINVDTTQGRVMLKGTAPSNEAREHATTLAKNVKGVVAVDNQLKVGG
ncbi:MAG: BON domain-containing protein [Pseudomonadota bacterium]|jgi:hyperosmotically inducible protein